MADNREKQVRIIVTDAYYGVLPALSRQLEGKLKGVGDGIYVFCEEKISLMAERKICDDYGGTFFADVFSFGNFLRSKISGDKILSKEGAAMAVKNILSRLPLKCFLAGGADFSASLYELIMQLKSAAVTPEDIERAANEVGSGVLKNKLKDIAAVFKAYEEFIEERGYKDQSSALSLLPEIIERDGKIKDAEVFVVGYTSFTVQIKNIIRSLINTAKGVTFILTEGKNEYLFVGETVSAVEKICAENNITCKKESFYADKNAEGKIITEKLFDPSSFAGERTETENVFFFAPENVYKEAETVAEFIAAKVRKDGERFKNFTVALPDIETYGDVLRSAFDKVNVPAVIDDRKKALCHPLVRLIVSYIDVFRKNFERETLKSFYKNPLITADPSLSDEFENYLYFAGINYDKIKNKFTVFHEDVEALENMRADIMTYFDRFDIQGLVDKVKSGGRLNGFSQRLKELAFFEDASVNEQILAAVEDILEEMKSLLGGVKLDYSEYKKIFLSGVSALELSVIPQYNDAVFVGGYRETAFARAKYLFAVGLKDGVPMQKDDSAILSDGDIDGLSQLKVLVDPKIEAVNRRNVEAFGLALAAFSDKLILSCPVFDGAGKPVFKSEALSYFSSLFNLTPFKFTDRYLSYKSGVWAFSDAVRKITEEEYGDSEWDKNLADATAFYFAEKDDALVNDIINRANSEIKERLEGKRPIAEESVSASLIENFYKCPYNAYLNRRIHAVKREKGEMDARFIGTLFHAVIKEYSDRRDEVTDKASSDALIEKITEDILKGEDYAKFNSLSAKESVARTVGEAKSFCFRLKNYYDGTLFKKKGSEVKIGEGEEKRGGYDALPILGGRAKLNGSIDRVDEYDGYVRIIDYKTGEEKDEDYKLFSGEKLQLYLYAKATGKPLAGAYYVNVNEGYGDGKEGRFAVGRTLDDEDLMNASDKNVKTEKPKFLPVTYVKKYSKFKGAYNKEEMDAFLTYAEKMADNAVRHMDEGVIIASPLNAACEYCDYAAICFFNGVRKREIKEKAVDESVIIGAVDNLKQTEAVIEEDKNGDGTK